VMRAVTVRRWALVFGECNVPYILGDVKFDSDSNNNKSNNGDNNTATSTTDHKSSNNTQKQQHTHTHTHTQQARTGHHIIGEIWLVNNAILEGLDEYEGITKGYYCRSDIEVRPCNNAHTQHTNTHDNTGILKADAYFKITSSPRLRSKKYYDEYTLEYHRQHYRAIQHIRVKQKMYLGEISRGERD